MEQADKVFFLVNNAAMADWIRSRNPTAESLHHLYVEGKCRLQTYQDMVDCLLNAVRRGYFVCAFFYGHPGVFVDASRHAIIQVRREGFGAWMVPGISAVDCLFSDLGVDPAHPGCQSFEATEFLLRKHLVDVTTHLIMWQIGVVGQVDYQKQRNISVGIQLLTEALIKHYSQSHEVIVYEAAELPGLPPIIHRTPLEKLPRAPITLASTLYIPPKTTAPIDPDMMASLEIDPADLRWPGTARKEWYRSVHHDTLEALTTISRWNAVRSCHRNSDC